MAYIEGGACRLVSRNRNAFKTFEPLAQAIGQELAGRSAILDGEIVHPGPDHLPAGEIPGALGAADTLIGTANLSARLFDDYNNIALLVPSLGILMSLGDLVQ